MNRALEKIARAFDVLASFALAGVVVWLGYARYGAEVDSLLLILALVLGGIASSIVCCAFHELGHIAVGLCCGFRFNSMRIGLLKIYRDEGKIRFTFKDIPESLAGSAEMLPKNADGLYAKYLAVIGGGLAFSLLFLLGAELTLDFYRSVPFAVYALVCTSLPYAFHIFFYNALPFNDDNMDTDGAMLKGLIKKEPSYLTAVNILAIEAYLYQGCSPAQIDEKLYFGAPQLPEDDLNFIILTSYRLMYYVDSGDLRSAAAAGERLKNLLEYVPAFYRGDIAGEALFCECYIKNDRAEAERMYPSLRQYLKGENTLQTRRIAAAYELYVNGDKIAALRELNEAERKAENYFVKGIAKYENKLLGRMRKEISEEIVNF